MEQGERRSSATLTVLGLGAVGADSIFSLHDRLASVQLVGLALKASSTLSEHPGTVNRAIDASDADWVMILREREVISDALAREIASALVPPRAWAFRIRSVPMYEGQALRLRTDDAGEIRLIQRRRARVDPATGTFRILGTVIRLESPLERLTFASAGEHRRYLEAFAVPHSTVRRVLRFVAAVMTFRRALGSRATLRYLWIESGFDQQGIVG